MFTKITSLPIVITAVVVTILQTLPEQSWAADIYCEFGAIRCDGTPESDVIFPSTRDSIILAYEGDDRIISGDDGSIYVYGGPGDDILIGGNYNDVLIGGPGNDRYDGKGGSDTISDQDYSSNDIASGGEVNDFIDLWGGSDRIHGGPGSDRIWADPTYRDFSVDVIDCGWDSDAVNYLYSGDGDFANTNCEFIENMDR